MVGLGLMGRGIATCLLSQGLPVTACDRDPERGEEALAHIETALAELRRRGFPAGPKSWRKRFTVVTDANGLAGCRFVIESINENLQLKRDVFRRLERALDRRAIIASNTSSLPISLLQAGRKNPERFIGMHWGEPAEVMRYLEIIPGKRTSRATVQTTRRLGELCGKTPTVLRHDIRGFVSNRLMYAMMREAFHLLESGVADLETIDTSFRNDIGWWATLAGPFRYMDLTGVPAYQAVMEGLLPKLANTKAVPRAMRKVVDGGGLGIQNGRGFYSYTPAAAKKWEKAWIDFTHDVRALVEKYEARVRS
ncbi:MAG: 3-hydroxyacyl-CoA dehydrogenase family protein [Bryobacteraceae bacterium]